MFYRTQNNAPEVYIAESRDFQLLGRLLDSVVNDSKFYIDSVPYINSVKDCPTNLLPLLSTKLGFFSKYTFTEKQLRSILQVFPWLLRYKGSKRAIYQAIFVFFRISGINPNFTILVRNSEGENDGQGGQRQNFYIIQIAFQSQPFNTKILDALFSYIIPPEYKVEYIYTVRPKNFTESVSLEQDKIEGIIVGNDTDTQIRGTAFDDKYVGSDEITNDLLSGIDTAITGHAPVDVENTGIVKSFELSGIIDSITTVTLNGEPLASSDYTYNDNTITIIVPVKSGDKVVVTGTNDSESVSRTFTITSDVINITLPSIQETLEDE